MVGDLIVDSRLKNRDEFKELHKKFMSNKYFDDFPNSSDYFHHRVISEIRSRAYLDLFKDDYFLELVYATIATWGLDRMDGSARLVEFNKFKDSIKSNKELLNELSKERLELLTKDELKIIKNKLKILFGSLDVMKSRSKLVGVSKTLHHLLPDLVPPIDRQYTLSCFHISDYNLSKKGELNVFEELFEEFYNIAKDIQLTKEDCEGDRDATSIPKLIDNIIITIGKSANYDS